MNVEHALHGADPAVDGAGEFDAQRARRWIGALGVLRQGRSHLVDRDSQGLAVCWMGAGAMCAADDGYVRMVDLGYGPRFVGVRWGDRPGNVYGALAHWLGIDDVWDLRVHITDLPDGLRTGVEQDVAAERTRRPLITAVEAMEHVADRGHPLWLLNDFGVRAATLADVMRVALDVDRDQVPA